jgi:hypothetical protein
MVFASARYNHNMILIRFSDFNAKRRALGFLAGRFSFKSWASGEMLVPESALRHLAVETAPFTVEGPATYEQHVPAVRNPPAVAVQRRAICSWRAGCGNPDDDLSRRGDLSHSSVAAGRSPKFREQTADFIGRQPMMGGGGEENCKAVAISPRLQIVLRSLTIG